MKIKWVEIENFRSIKDSKRFYLNSKLNILAGKNESGKSNILKALKSFSENEFNTEDKSHYSSENSLVKVCFIIEGQEELKEIFNDVGEMEYDEELNELIVARDGNSTYFSGEIGDILLDMRLDYYLENENAFKSIIDNINSVLEELSEDFDVDFYVSEENFVYPDYNEYSEFLRLMKGNIWDPSDGEEYNYGDKDALNRLKGLVLAFEQLYMNAEKPLIVLFDLIPNIILFNSFEDNLPEYIFKKDINKPIVKSFFSLTSCVPEDLFKLTGIERSKLVNSISTTITGNFQNYYNQNKMRIKVNADGEKVAFEIYDDKDEINPFLISQRSRGFQWFLSFFITLNAAKKKNTIVLIDEPGLFLHAKAQEDVLEMLNGLSDVYQIIMTTHSPYFINPDRLDRVSLVIKDENYTYVENKVHKGSDYTTLTPIITAIGLDITRSIGFSRDLNILTEGISDYYYLQAMKEYLRNTHILVDFNIIPAQGVNSVSNLTCLLLGWDLPFVALFDNDNAGRRNHDKITRDLHVDGNHLAFVSMEENMAIEDLFSCDDFQKYIFSELDSTKSNSDNVKNKEKALLAKLFNNKIMNSEEKITFSAVTVNNFIDLFKRLSLIVEEIVVGSEEKSEVRK
ncbi:AAA family ATPase [Bacillus thuringiensis]|uniref:AAA family ATPase n=1 Tax=Bacillus thuringiensis TaxID=1428 RepID=UPI000CD9004D|nr:AAA family ATPase [Bacillus thuringiensis]QFQ28473.1 AAA family ATPase [Bacillus thuringiensis]